MSSDASGISSISKSCIAPATVGPCVCAGQSVKRDLLTLAKETCCHWQKRLGMLAKQTGYTGKRDLLTLANKTWYTGKEDLQTLTKETY